MRENQKEAMRVCEVQRDFSDTRSGEPLWLDKPGAAIGSNEKRGEKRREMRVWGEGGSDYDQEWRAFMAGQTRSSSCYQRWRKSLPTKQL